MIFFRARLTYDGRIVRSMATRSLNLEFTFFLIFLFFHSISHLISLHFLYNFLFHKILLSFSTQRIAFTRARVFICLHEMNVSQTLSQLTLVSTCVFCCDLINLTRATSLRTYVASHRSQSVKFLCDCMDLFCFF